MAATPSSGTASNAGLDSPAGDAAFLLAAVFAAVAAGCWLAAAACGWLENCGEPDRLGSGVDARGVNEASTGTTTTCSAGTPASIGSDAGVDSWGVPGNCAGTTETGSAGRRTSIGCAACGWHDPGIDFSIIVFAARGSPDAGCGWPDAGVDSQCMPGTAAGEEQMPVSCAAEGNITKFL